MPRRSLLIVLSVVLLAACLLPAGPAKVDYRKVDSEIQARNAARMDNGGRISLELLDEKVFKDRRTYPPDVVDGSVHSRQVITGVPYRFRIDLVDELPIEAIHFICSDYANEQSPKDVSVKLSDGTTLNKTLEKLPAESRKPKPRQRLDVGGRKARWVEVTVLSNHPGGLMKNGQPCGWGGIGEIEVVTTADLKPYLTVEGYNPDLPADIRSEPPRRDYSGVKVTLPTAIPLGQRPGIYLTADEWKALFETMRNSPRGKPVLDGLIEMADGYLAGPVTHPDPNVPAQVTDRGDAQARAHDALSKQAGICGYAYRISGDEKYARRVRDILVGYGRLYPEAYKEHKGANANDTSKVMAQRLSEAMWLIPQIQAYDLTADSGAFSDADRKLVEADLIRCALTFIHSKQPAAKAVAAKTAANPNWRTAPAEKKTRPGALGNWTAFYNMAYIQGGSVLGDRDWIDVGADGLKYMIENGIGADGMWGEGAIGYQQFARHAMVGGLEALARKGIDVWSYKANAFKNLFDSEFAYAYPDGTSPGINDSGRAPVGSGWTAMAFDYAYLRYGDENYAHTVNGTQRQLHQSPACYFPTQVYRTLPEVPVRGQGSLVFDKLGYAILRGKDAGGETFLLMDYGPHGGVHGHRDKLNLILFADGDELAGEAEGFRYEDDRHANWTTQSIAHWTLSVDEHSQNPTTGRLVCFADAGDVKVIRAQSGEAYAGVVLDRTVVQMPGYVLDVYRAWGPARHTFDYPLCFRGTLDRMKDIEEASLKPMSGTTPGYRHILAAGPTPVEGEWTGVWSRDAAEGDPNAETTDRRRGGPAGRVRATVLPAPGLTAFLAHVPGERRQAILRQAGSDATFVCLIDPYRATDAVRSVKALKTSGPVPATGVEVLRTDGGRDLIVVRNDPMPDGKPGPATSFAGQTTQVLVTVCRLDKEGKQVSRTELGKPK
ncbi:MAG TPA: heparinase II/III family protein [Phycisphaerae bacterium]|nr:heparinase II/III family protein [Phycisphaerae bacterium]